MNNRPFFSILIPNYNNYFFFVDAVESVLNQDFKDFEIIVCDQSNSKMAGLVKKYCVDHNIVYLYQNEPSIALARNNLISNSFGRFLVWLDSDDLLEINALSKLHDFICKDPETYVVFFGWKIINEAGFVIDKDSPRLLLDYLMKAKNTKYAFLEKLCTTDDMNDVWNKCMSRNAFQKAYILSNQNMGEDFFIVSHLMENKFSNIRIFPDVLYSYRVNQKSVTHVFKKSYWIDYLSIFELKLAIHDKYFNGSLLDSVLNYMIDKTFSLIIFASSKIANLKSMESNTFRQSDLFKKIISFLKHKKGKTNIKKKIVMFLFKHKLRLALVLIHLLFYR